MSTTLELLAVQIQAAMPDAQVQGEDLTGGGDHFRLSIVSQQFEGKALVTRHRMVYKALSDAFRESLHALQLETMTPDEARER